jgi:hypothetical protein
MNLYYIVIIVIIIIIINDDDDNNNNNNNNNNFQLKQHKEQNVLSIERQRHECCTRKQTLFVLRTIWKT